MKLLIDTNRYTDLARGVTEVVKRMESAEEIWMSLVVLGELRAGFAAGTKTNENEEALERFLHRFAVRMLRLDEETTIHYGLVHSTLRRKGKMIPSNDVWIAARHSSMALRWTLETDTFSTFPG